MDTHICPKCSQECIHKNGIMCTIQGCIKDGTAKNDGGFNDIFNTMFGGGFGGNTSAPFGNNFSSNPFADILNRYKK